MDIQQQEFVGVMKAVGLSSYQPLQFEQDFKTYYHGSTVMMTVAKSIALAVAKIAGEEVNLDEYRMQQIIERISKRSNEIAASHNEQLIAEIAEELIAEWKLPVY